MVRVGLQPELHGGGGGVARVGGGGGGFAGGSGVLFVHVLESGAEGASESEVVSREVWGGVSKVEEGDRAAGVLTAGQRR